MNAIGIGIAIDEVLFFFFSVASYTTLQHSLCMLFNLLNSCLKNDERAIAAAIIKITHERTGKKNTFYFIIIYYIAGI